MASCENPVMVTPVSGNDGSAESLNERSRQDLIHYAADEVKLSPPKFLVELTAQANRELEFHKWMGANKLPQHFRQKRRHKILRRAEP